MKQFYELLPGGCSAASFNTSGYPGIYFFKCVNQYQLQDSEVKVVGARLVIFIEAEC